MAFFIPLSAAQAGVFSFLGTLFSGGSTEVFERDSDNSQTASILQAAINPDPNPSKGGGNITVVAQSALLSETGPSGTLADIEDEDGLKSDQISVYVVREGDSLSQIADMFGVSINTIIWANDIGRRGLIREGQTLVILPVNGVRYTVQKGDTIASIAKQFDADTKDITEFNGIIDADALSVGDVVVIPGGTISAPAPQARSHYVVQNTSTPHYSGYYVLPLQGGVKSQGLHGYNAVDLAAPWKTPVLAAAGGRVIVSRHRAGNPWFGGYGNYIVIEHDNGTQTLYAHLSGNIVNRGWRVVQGQVIGYVGSTGRSTGPHLHFEVRGARNPFR